MLKYLVKSNIPDAFDFRKRAENIHVQGETKVEAEAGKG
jgi:hypothetical protein